MAITYYMNDYGVEVLGVKDKLNLLAEEISAFAEFEDNVEIDFLYIDIYYDDNKYTEHEMVLSTFVAPEQITFFMDKLLEYTPKQLRGKMQFTHVTERVAGVITSLLEGRGLSYDADRA